ncbi:Hypothetical protein MVR_LOCUS54 [uncultured virus]|nr:Hypothetical protein MVR_LOCUS54 [uncultured virus]
MEDAFTIKVAIHIDRISPSDCSMNKSSIFMVKYGHAVMSIINQNWSGSLQMQQKMMRQLAIRRVIDSILGGIHATSRLYASSETAWTLKVPLGWVNPYKYRCVGLARCETLRASAVTGMVNESNLWACKCELNILRSMCESMYASSLNACL